MVIYRGAGFLTLLLPIVGVLLLMALWPDPSVGKGNTSLAQFLLGVGIGSLVNVALGLLLNRGPRSEGVRHHFFFIPMQWPALAIAVVCGVVGLLKG